MKGSFLVHENAKKVDHIFVYGTLMRGQPQHKLIQVAGILDLKPATVSGELLDMGAYPAVRLRTGANSRVHGQVIKLKHMDAALPRLDEYEGPEFRREITHIDFSSRRTVQAWIYLLADGVAAGPVIPSGRWVGVSISFKTLLQ